MSVSFVSVFRVRARYQLSVICYLSLGISPPASIPSTLTLALALTLVFHLCHLSFEIWTLTFSISPSASNFRHYLNRSTIFLLPSPHCLLLTAYFLLLTSIPSASTLALTFFLTATLQHRSNAKLCHMVLRVDVGL